MKDRCRHSLEGWRRGAVRAAAVGLVGLFLLLSGCGQQESKATYTLVGVQDFSHGRVGRFSARVVVKPDLPREMVRIVVREVVSKVVETHRADVCWVVVHTGQPPTMDNLIASAQWVSSALPAEDRPYIEVSDDAVSYAGAPIYITWP